jgi:hypothetical protein
VQRKSRRRLVIVGGFALLLAFVPVGYYFANKWLCQRDLEALYREIDSDDPNWRYADLGVGMPEPPPDEQNAAVQLMRVRDLLVKTPFTPPPPAPKKAPVGRNVRLPENDVKATRAALAKLGPMVLDEARKLKDLPEGRFRFKVVENPFDETKPSEVGIDLLPTMHLLHHDARLRAHDGETEAAAESCQALLHAGHAINDHPSMMSQLIRAGFQDAGVASIERTLGQGAVSEQRLTALQHALAREAELNAMYPAMRGERAWCQQGYVLIEKGTISDPRDLLARDSSTLCARIHEMFSSPRYADELRLHNELVNASKLPLESQPAAFQAVAKKAFESANIAAQGKGYLAGNAVEFHDGQARLRCAVTALAAERYRLAHGRWPENAEELVKAGLLKEALKDPFDGQPLRWKQTPTGIIIHSIGSARNGVRTAVGFELWRPEMRGMPAPR